MAGEFLIKKDDDGYTVAPREAIYRRTDNNDRLLPLQPEEIARNDQDVARW